MKPSEHSRAQFLPSPSHRLDEPRPAVAVMRPKRKAAAPVSEGRSGGAFFRQGAAPARRGFGNGAAAVRTGT